MKKELMRQIDDIDKEILVTQREISESQGTINAIMERIKDDFGCDSLEDAKAKLKEMKSELEEHRDEYKEACEELLDVYDEFKAIKESNEYPNK